MHQADIRRDVRVVALAAVYLTPGQAEMLALEITLIAVMATEALIRNRFRQKTHRRTSVGQMAAQAVAFLGGRVSVAVLHPFGKIGVAGEAEPPGLVQQQMVNLSRVRLVTTAALTVGHRLVTAEGSGQFTADIVAVGTDCIQPVNHQGRMLRGVMLMAAITGLLLEGRVHHRVIFLHQRLVTGEAQGIAVVLEKTGLTRGVTGVTTVALTDLNRGMNIRHLGRTGRVIVTVGAQL